MPGIAGHRRSPLIAPLLLAGYLVVAPWIFFLAPLAILLLASRPRTAREWLWVALALIAGVGLLRTAPADLADRTIRAAGMFFAGTYVTMALFGNRSLFVRCMVATSAAAAFTTGWFLALRLRFSTLRDAVAMHQWDVYRTLMKGLPATPPPAADEVVGGTPLAELGYQLARTVEQVSELFPAIIALTAVAGGWIAWTWYHRLSSKPIGAPPGLFRHFHFSDQMMWWLVAALAGTMLPLPQGLHLAAKNFLVVVLGLYAARGLAVLRTVLLNAPPFLVVLLCLIALPLLPLAVTGCIVVGVADTWLDLRRRAPPPDGVSP
ncbi:MAG: hypothetical protein ABIR59_09525 [Gemmatimonadales bacterium]